MKDTKEITVGKTKLVAEPGTQEVITTRLFDAPRERLFKALTDPSLIPQWWGPADLKTIVEKMDVKPGGSWRFIHRDAAGREYAFHGVYHEISSPERLVYTFEFEGTPGHVALETVTLENHGGKTMLRDQLVFQSVEDRDGMVQSGMEEGNNASMDRLDTLLAKP
jgi:uncharacterized protein YndB with AHSA1/START domain